MRRSRLYPWTYVESLLGGWRCRSLFSQLKCFAIFIGQPRGGNSLVGSLLNAHRNLCLSQELGALRYVSQGYRRSQLQWLIYRQDREGGRRGHFDHDYRYAVPGQWQGCFEELVAIGDVKAGASTEIISRQPDLLPRLRQLVGIPLRLFHVVRNPFHVIAAIQHTRPEVPLESIVDRYFKRCETNWRTLNDPFNGVLTIRWEQLLASPRECLTQLCEHLDLPVDSEYLDACQLVLSEQPREQLLRGRVAWNQELVDGIYRQMECYPFLQGYRFEGRLRRMRTAA